ncbi:ABC transporter substrate-binding protein [Streptomyces xiaopingdaonensis]|uniref:ABC transporter substrate-binding protein n=1 Tax=Streptomyces xiaopingdaonensis TaxID=1565415 RepID=UPI000312F16C|nr:ABC transporter substrate-binding protein [Streptomyces xiaopingdaonensis]
MFDRKGPLRSAALLLPLALLASACSAFSGDEADADHTLTVGTTSAPSVLDPAAAWDGSWELYRNVYQTLLSFPSSSTSPEPEAARACGFTDAQSRVYRCTLRKGLTFSNGNKLDAAAVRHSIERVRTIGAKSGPAALLGSLDKIETKDSRTVVFHLKRPDATFPFILSTPATSLVDPASYPRDALREKSGIVGSGPYTLHRYRKDDRAELRRNGDYRGPIEAANDGVTIRYFKRSTRMVSALERGDIDVTYRGLTPSQITRFENAGPKSADGAEEIQLSEMVGTEIHYLVFNPRDPVARKTAVRRAVAQLIDRKALVRRVHYRTADPLYSMVPGGIAGHTNAFLDVYGEPDVDKARKTLDEAGVRGRTTLRLWYPTDRYGAATKREFEEIKRQLEESKLFEVELRGRPWDAFQKGYLDGEYPVFGRGWSADFPDADNYVAPFVGPDNAMGTPYASPELTEKLLPASRKQSNRGAAGGAFKEAQRVLAEDARLLPLWQGRLYLASAKDVAGIEFSLDPAGIMRMWELHEKSSW